MSVFLYQYTVSVFYLCLSSVAGTIYWRNDFFSLFPHVCHWCFCKDELVKIERIYYWVLYSIYWCTCLFYSILDVQVCFTLYLGGQVCFILYLGGQVCFVPVNADFIVMALCHNLKLSTKCLQNYSFYLRWLLMVILHL